MNKNYRYICKIITLNYGNELGKKLLIMLISRKMFSSKVPFEDPKNVGVG